MMEERAENRDPAINAICEGHHKMTPKEMKTYDSLEELQDISDNAYGALLETREEIAGVLRPRTKPQRIVKAKRKKPSKGKDILRGPTRTNPDVFKVQG